MGRLAFASGVFFVIVSVIMGICISVVKNAVDTMHPFAVFTAVIFVVGVIWGAIALDRRDNSAP